MKKKLVSILLVLILFAMPLGLTGCDDDWEEEDESEYFTDDTDDTDAGETRSTEKENSDMEPIEIGSDAQSATILIYMNGSDLESKAGEASVDIAEMLTSGVGKNVNVLVQTMGTKQWQDFDISSESTQIHRVHNGELELIRDHNDQLDCTVTDTLSDFIKYGKTHYPADRYLLIFWDHGGGPVYGFGYDEWQSDTSSLTLDEIQEALRRNNDISFDIIGMDCCIMANLETCYVLAPYCKYAVLSEDFESGLGWSYTSWMKLIEENPGISSPMLGKKIIDSMVSANENDDDAGGSSTMILVNEKAVPDLMDKWTKYAYANSDKLLGSNYSKLHKAIGRSLLDLFFDAWEDDDSFVTMDDYYVSDMLSIVESVGEEGKLTSELRTALKDCTAYFGHTSDKNELTGMAVSLPYGDWEYYEKQVSVYKACGIDQTYIEWLEGFVEASGSDDYCDYSEFEDSWGGWETYEEGWGSCDGSEDFEDWEYDYEEKLWYLYEDGNVYLYDDETDTIFFYDDFEDEVYYYDEEDDEWYIVED